jgi:LCP family protein required for cell wall assembly
MRPTVYTSRPRDSYPARLLRALLSAIIPGLGQLVAGVRRRAFFLIAIFAVVTIAAIVILSRGVDAIAGWVVQPKVLLALLWVDIIVMLIRLFAVIDAWLTAKTGAMKPARQKGSRMLLTGLGLVVILVFTVAPHAVAGYYTIVSRNLLTNVFAPGSTSTTQKVTASSSGGGNSGTTTASQGQDTTTSLGTGPTITGGSDSRITILLIGLDSGYMRTGARSDSMNVATVDLKTGKVAMFGLPRNTTDVPIGPKTAAALANSSKVKTVNGKKVWTDLLNALYGTAVTHPSIAPDGGDPGAEALRETASLMLGIPIDYYAEVNMLGLADMVDAVGGVTINLKTALHITYAPLNPGEPKKYYVFNVGLNKLNGLQALAYARDRSDSDDYVRMGRQRCILMGMLYQNSVTSLTLHFGNIAKALEDNVKTSIPVSALPDLIKLRGKLDAGSMITEGFTPTNYLLSYDNGSNVLDTTKIHAAVKTILNDPAQWIADHPPAAGSGGASDCWKITK